MITGTFLMVGTPLASHRAAPVMPRRFLDPGPLAGPGLRRIRLRILITAVGISVACICLAAVAQGQGKAGAAGYLEAGIGLGSVVGGVAWSRRNHTRSRSQHLAGLIGVLAAGLLAASLTSNLVVLGVVMAFAVAVAPLFVVSYLASDDVTPAHQRTEASTWINTANNLGSSTGASVAGLAIDRIGPSWGFFAGGLLLTPLTSLAILLSRRSIDVPASISTANSG
jgi:predicted MFS family arabinose efflux permease